MAVVSVRCTIPEVEPETLNLRPQILMGGTSTWRTSGKWKKNYSIKDLFT